MQGKEKKNTKSLKAIHVLIFHNHGNTYYVKEPCNSHRYEQA